MSRSSHINESRTPIGIVELLSCVLVACSILAFAATSAAGTLERELPEHPEPINMAIIDQQLYAITQQYRDDLRQRNGRPVFVTKLARLPLGSESFQIGMLGNSPMGLESKPHLSICGEFVHWSQWESHFTQPIPCSYRMSISEIFSPTKTQTRVPDVGRGVTESWFERQDESRWPISLSPVETIHWARRTTRKNSSFEYSLEAQSDTLVVWVYQGTVLSEWKYNPTKKAEFPKNGTIRVSSIDTEGIPDHLPYWEKARSYPNIVLKEKVHVIPGKEPLLLTDKAILYRLDDTGTEWIADIRISSDNEVQAKATIPKLSTRYVLLQDQDRKKHVLFQWANKELTPLDVLDKEKQNIEPFLPAKDVDPKIIKAATVMLKQMQKDEQEVAEMKKELEAKRKAKAEEEAKKPKPQTLQERLQQN
jgi:hypothetical protein